MTQTSDNNKRIVKNTQFLYMRMFVMMLATLFTSRIVLDVLGVADYRLNNIIGGVMVLFLFWNSVNLSTTQRFLNLKDYIQIYSVHSNCKMFLQLPILTYKS